MIACTISNLIGFCALALTTLLILPTRAQAQWSGRDGWVEEPATKSLNVEGDLGHSYLDPASVHRGDDGLVYFNESSGVTQPEEIGRTGFMKDAYDCAKNIKYMCVGLGDWRNDQKSAIPTPRMIPRCRSIASTCAATPPPPRTPRALIRRRSPARFRPTLSYTRPANRNLVRKAVRYFPIPLSETCC